MQSEQQSKRDFREETALNSAEYSLLKTLSSELGLSKAAVIRFALHQLGDKFMRNERMRETGLSTEE